MNGVHVAVSRIHGLSADYLLVALIDRQGGSDRPVSKSLMIGKLVI